MKPPAGKGGRPAGRSGERLERASRSEIYLHLVRATYRRMPLVTGDVERAVYACIMDQARKAGCELLAIGGMPDHVHVAVRVPPTAAPATLAKQMKGVSSTMIRTQVRPGEFFGWQDGYGAFSFSRSHVERVVAYVRNQKTHHGASSAGRSASRAGTPPMSSGSSASAGTLVVFGRGFHTPGCSRGFQEDGEVQ